MSEWYKDRQAPLSNKLIIGEIMAYEHEGKWYDKKTHEELNVTSLEDLFKETENKQHEKRVIAVSEFKIKPNVFRIMHPFEGGPLDVISAQVYFDLEKAYADLKAENQRLRADNDRHKELNRKLANHNADYNDENVRLREALKFYAINILKAENERLRGKLRKAIDYVNMQDHHNMSCRYKITYYQWENAEPCDCSIKEFIEEITP